jgi:hypothetical protein
MFKQGDNIILVDGFKPISLTSNKVYTVKSYDKNVNWVLIINDDEKYGWYDVRNFEIDILKLRKEKLLKLKEKICLKSVTK